MQATQQKGSIQMHTQHKFQPQQLANALPAASNAPSVDEIRRWPSCCASQPHHTTDHFRGVMQ